MLRGERSKLLIQDMKKWLEENLIKARPQSGLRSAMEYLAKYWTGLTLFLEDPKIPLTNNEAERTIRHAVLGRKNFHGSRTINGADVTAILYSIIESCKKVELDPRSYLSETVKNILDGKTAMTPLETAKAQRACQ